MRSAAIVGLLGLVVGVASCGDDRDRAGDASTTRDATGGPTCASLGGSCGCAGGCETGFTAHPNLSLCPQPCDECGACSQECCVPEDADLVDAGGGDAAAGCATPPVDRTGCGAEGTICPVTEGCCVCAVVSVCDPEPAWYCQSTANDAACPAEPPTPGDSSCPMQGLVCRYCDGAAVAVRECTTVGWIEGGLAICR